MVLKQENTTSNLARDAMVTEKTEQTAPVESPAVAAILQTSVTSLRSRPGSPRWAVMHLLKRIALLKEAADTSLRPDISLVWPEGFEPPPLPTSSEEALWQEILVKFGACESPAKIAARHFDRIVQVGMDANAVPFPCMPSRQSMDKNLVFAVAHHAPWKPPSQHQRLGHARLSGQFHSTGLAMDRPSKASQISLDPQDTLAFRFLPEVEKQWTNPAEKEVFDLLLAGRAQDPYDLRQAFYREPPLDMELLPWPMLQNGIVGDDICTDAQTKVAKLREEQPLSLERLEKRRAVLAKKLKGELNRRVFDECLPMLERESALLELQAARAQDKALESAQYDELAAQGAQFVVWPRPHERCWPEQSSAWKNHCRWFAMWRSQPVVASKFAYKPMKRSNSLSSIGSWAAVSDISWIDIESKASECGWQEVLDEQAPSLAAAKPTDIPKAAVVEIRSLSKPPSGVCLTMEVMCILLQVPPTKLKAGGVDYWSSAKELLGQPDFLSRLNALSDYLPASVLDAVAPYMCAEDFTPEAVGKGSSACKALCTWARELYKYHTLGQASAEAAWRDYVNKPVSELLIESQEAVAELPKAALQELKALASPPVEVAIVCSCFLHLFAGIADGVELTKRGNVKDASWRACQKFMSNPDATLKCMHDLRDTIDAGAVPAKNIRKVRKVLGHSLNPEAVKAKSVAAGHLCKWLISTIAYYEHAAPIQQQAQVSQTSPPAKAVAEASKHLSKADIVEIKSLEVPPKPVMIVCVCVCILLGRDGNSGWAGAKALVSDVQFLRILLEHKRENVTTEQIEKVREIINKEGPLDGDKVKCASKAAYGLFQWVLAMIEFE